MDGIVGTVSSSHDIPPDAANVKKNDAPRKFSAVHDGMKFPKTNLSGNLGLHSAREVHDSFHNRKVRLVSHEYIHDKFGKNHALLYPKEPCKFAILVGGNNATLVNRKVTRLPSMPKKEDIA